MCLYVCAIYFQVSTGPEESVRSSEVGVIGGYEPFHMGNEDQTGVPHKNRTFS